MYLFAVASAATTPVAVEQCEGLAIVTLTLVWQGGRELSNRDRGSTTSSSGTCFMAVFMIIVGRYHCLLALLLLLPLLLLLLPLTVIIVRMAMATVLMMTGQLLLRSLPLWLLLLLLLLPLIIAYSEPVFFLQISIAQKT